MRTKLLVKTSTTSEVPIELKAYGGSIAHPGGCYVEPGVEQVTAEKATDNSGDWATVTLRVGVTRDKLRTLVIQFYADTRVSLGTI